MKNFSSKEIRFSGDSIKSCVVFIDLVDSTKNTITMEGSFMLKQRHKVINNIITKL